MVQEAQVGDADLPNYAVQLIDAYVLEARISRIPGPEGPAATGPLAETAISEPSFTDDRKRLEQVLNGRVSVPYRDGQFMMVIECSILGTFISTEPIDPKAFTGRETIVVLWPYLRASVGELGRMTGLPVPPLPTLDVLSVINARPLDEPTPDPQPRKRRGKAKGPQA